MYKNNKDDIISETYNIFGYDIFKKIDKDNLTIKAKNIEAYDDKIDFSSITKVHKL